MGILLAAIIAVFFHIHGVNCGEASDSLNEISVGQFLCEHYEWVP